MMAIFKRAGLRDFWFGIVLLGCVACSTMAVARDRVYPLQGEIVALGTSQETTGGGSTPVVNGTGGGSGALITTVHRTYTVKSSTRVYVLECPYSMNGIHIHAPRECGGNKNIGIGDVIHFRVEKNKKNNAYIQTDKGKEQKLSVVSEAKNEASKKEE